MKLSLPLRGGPGGFIGVGFYLGPIRLTFLSYYRFRPSLIWLSGCRSWNVGILRWPERAPADLGNEKS